MINIERLCASHTDAVKKIRLAEEQVRFAGTAEEFLSDGSDSMHQYVIRHDETIVGFFRIDTAYASQYPFCPQDALGLRGFVIDEGCQRQGIGTAAVKALFPYLKQSYPESGSVFLTVNCQNPVARHCYQKSGFTDTDEHYLGGPAGPQHIMFAELNNR